MIHMVEALEKAQQEADDMKRFFSVSLVPMVQKNKNTLLLSHLLQHIFRFLSLDCHMKKNIYTH